MSTVTEYQYLARNLKSSYKQLFVKGTRIRARVLYGWYACNEPQSLDDIAQDYGLPVEAVREAIAYCESDPPELLDDYRREEAQMAATGMKDPNYKSNPSPRLLSAEEIAGINRS